MIRKYEEYGKEESMDEDAPYFLYKHLKNDVCESKTQCKGYQ